MTDNEKYAERLRKARAMLKLAESEGKVGNEAAAMAVIGKYHEYVAKFGLSLEDIQNDPGATSKDRYHFEETYSGRANKSNTGWHNVDYHMSFDIAEFCSVKVGIRFHHTSDGVEQYIRYFGHEVDVEFAHWLRRNIKDAMQFEWEIYRDFVLGGKVPDPVTAKRSFCSGMASRLRERMKREATAVPAGTTALIIKKNALVEKHAKAAGFEEARGGKARAAAFNAAAYGAGRSAGGYVDLGRGVGSRASTGAGAVAQITKR